MSSATPRPGGLPTEEDLKAQEFEVTHVVTGPMVIATTGTGVQRYLYEGAPVPPDVSVHECARLVGTGLVRPVRSGTLEPMDDDELAAHESGGDVEVAPLPSRTAGKGDWVTYAVGRGMRPDDAKAMSRDELADRYTVR